MKDSCLEEMEHIASNFEGDSIDGKSILFCLHTPHIITSSFQSDDKLDSDSDIDTDITDWDNCYSSNDNDTWSSD